MPEKTDIRELGLSEKDITVAVRLSEITDTVFEEGLLMKSTELVDLIGIRFTISYYFLQC